MTSVYTVRAVWSGFTGSPGYSNFHFMDIGTDAGRNAAGAAVRLFFFNQTAFLLSTWSVAVQSEVTEHDMATGTLLGAATMTTVPTSVPGTSSSASWAGGSGYSIKWNTGMVWNGRRVTGRTFMVPAVSCFEADGTLLATAITTIGAAAQALINTVGAEFAVWSKVFTKPTGTMTVDEAKAFKQQQISGNVAPVTGYFVKDTAAQLRTRRT